MMFYLVNIKMIISWISLWNFNAFSPLYYFSFKTKPAQRWQLQNVLRETSYHQLCEKQLTCKFIYASWTNISKRLLNNLTESSEQKICLTQTWYLLHAHGGLHVWRYVRRMGRSMVHRVKFDNPLARYLKTVSLDFEEDWLIDWLIDWIVFYAVYISAIFQPYNDGDFWRRVPPGKL